MIKIILSQFGKMIMNDNKDILQPASSKLSESDSLISKFCDQFNIKESVIKLSCKTPFEVTREFIDVFILFIFIFIVFLEAGILELKFTFHMVVLSVIGISAAIEFFYVNTSLLKRLLKKYVGRDSNVKRFLDKTNTLSPMDTNSEIKNLFFSSNCMNYFLKSIANNRNEYPPYVIEAVLSTQYLSKENLDLLFSPDVLKNILPDLVIDVLSENINCLTYEHIFNIYEQLKNNDSVTRVLVATQSNSYSLGDTFSDDEKLSNYYIKYQLNEEHFDWKLKIIPLSKFRIIKNYSFWIITSLFLFSYFYGRQIPIIIEPEEFIVVLIASLFFGMLFSLLLVGGILGRIRRYYYRHLVKNIIK